MIKIIELIAFIVSAVSLIYGYLTLQKKKIPKYFQQYVCAVGCYMLEELWVIVNSLLGVGALNGLVTVRLVGFFGCLCFMLSANSHGFNKITDEGKNITVRLFALLAPAVLIMIYAIYISAAKSTASSVTLITGFLALSPALFASYFSFKHLLLPDDEMGYLKSIRGIDLLSLVFYAANFAYPVLYMYVPNVIMGIYDIILAVILFAVIILCGKGASEWNTLI